MNATQAENLRVLIRHAEGAMTRTLDMNSIRHNCDSPACMLGEAICVLRIPEMIVGEELISTEGIWPSVVAHYSEAAEHRLFGMGGTNAWKRASVTPQEWAIEARKVLAENGYEMTDPFKRFMEKVREPVSLEATASHR